jgi:hypothetical protein
MRRVLPLWLFAAGCVFQVGSLDPLPPNGDDLAATVDAGVPSDGPAPDLGEAAPDLAEADLLPAPDLAGCTVVSHAFSDDPSAAWRLFGDSKPDPVEKRLQLTGVASSEAGSVFYRSPLAVGSLHATFKVYIGDGDGADGMAFVLARADSLDDLAPPDSGNTLGYRGLDGLAVELDTHHNGIEPQAEHVALCAASTGDHHVAGTPPKLDCDCVRTVDVRLKDDRIVVKIDDTTVLDQGLLPTVFPADTYYVGFTAATGGKHNRHAVFDVHIAAGPGDACY